MKDHKDVPESLRKRRGVRAVITVWIGLIPLFIGIIGIFNFLNQKEQSYKGGFKRLHYSDDCGFKKGDSDCLTLEIGEVILRNSLMASDAKRYLNLVQFSDSAMNAEIAAIKDFKASREQIIRDTEREKRIRSIQDHISEVEVRYAGNTMKELYLNGQLVIKYRSALWWGLVSLLLGILWIGVHMLFFIKDPYRVYRDNY